MTKKYKKKILYSQYGTIDCQSVLLVYIDEIGWVTFFSVDKSKSLLSSLMPDDHLILILFPPVILTWVT